MLFEHKKDFIRIVDGFAREAGRIQVGNSLMKELRWGLSLKAQLDCVTGYVEQGKAAGATAAFGDGRIGNKGYFAAPPIFTGGP